ncbi:hypothetical protein JTZ10_17165, partial [Gordonia rubripertincta]|nr:hypothetical protein [Gordonia rubripertincta]
LRTELGWTPNYVDFRAGLAATIDWYRDNTSWWQPAKDAVEQKYAATRAGDGLRCNRLLHVRDGSIV